MIYVENAIYFLSVSSIEKILSREMKLINSCSCPMLSTFWRTYCAWFDCYDQLPICSIVRMACGRRQSSELVTFTVLGWLRAWWTPYQNGHHTPLQSLQWRNILQPKSV